MTAPRFDADDYRQDVCMYLREDGYPVLADRVSKWHNDTIVGLSLVYSAQETAEIIIRDEHDGEGI